MALGGLQQLQPAAGAQMEVSLPCCRRCFCWRRWGTCWGGWEGTCCMLVHIAVAALRCFPEFRSTHDCVCSPCFDILRLLRFRFTEFVCQCRANAGCRGDRRDRGAYDFPAASVTATAGGGRGPGVADLTHNSQHESSIREVVPRV